MGTKTATKLPPIDGHLKNSWQVIEELKGRFYGEAKGSTCWIDAGGSGMASNGGSAAATGLHKSVPAKLAKMLESKEISRVEGPMRNPNCPIDKVSERWYKVTK